MAKDNVTFMQDYLIKQVQAQINQFNVILDAAYKTMTDEEFNEFGNEMLEEVQRLTQKIKEIHK